MSLVDKMRSIKINIKYVWSTICDLKGWPNLY